VLDIGCGSGYLEEIMAPLVKNITALDVSEQFVEICKKRCETFNNVNTTLLDADTYTDLSFLNESFSLVLLLSVIQYYNDFEEVKELITSVKKIVKPGGKLLIVDIPLKRSRIYFILDMIASILQSIRFGYFFKLLKIALIKYLADLDKSSYSRINSLHFTIEDFETAMRSMGLEGKLIRKNFSVYANRVGILIEFENIEKTNG
jgi:ubiquinone/menaquinone biosynthesis C-methylase UbiE